MSRHRRIAARPSRRTLCAAAGTAATASVAAAVIAAGPALLTPGAQDHRHLATDLALTGSERAARADQPRHAGQAVDPDQPVNPALAARQALNERYTAAVEAARRAARMRAAARRAAEQRRSAAELRRQAATPPASGTPQQIAMAMLADFGWSGSEFSCLDSLWEQESGWNPYAANPSSGAYGIPQALPGSKMATAGPDWETNAATQIRWGLGYIQSTYGSPCAAWAHETSSGWY